MKISLYIHIPFCKSKCNYCDFYSIKASDNIISEYITALLQELKYYSKSYKLRTIYIGGGTPSILKPSQIKLLMKNIKNNFDIIPNPEISIEVNPESINKEFIENLQESGITRISIGVQTFNNKSLKIAGRLADAQTIHQKINLIKRMHLTNWSADMIYGLPYQNLDNFKNDIETIIDYEPNHISLYALSIEKGTPFDSLYNTERTLFPSDEEVSDMYLFANDYLETKKYFRYEISNFAQKGFECKHNLTYWNGNNYLGVGASAVSTIDKWRWQNISNVDKYIQYLKNKKMPYIKKLRLTEDEKLKEFIMLQLRLVNGVNLLQLKQRYNVDLMKIKGAEIEKFINAGFLKLKDNNLFLTPRGIIVSNSIMSELI